MWNKKYYKVSVGESDVIAAASGSKGKSDARGRKQIGRAAKTRRERLRKIVCMRMCNDGSTKSHRPD